MLLYYKQRGAIGVGELTANLPVDDPMLDNLFYHCAECDMPVIIHSREAAADTLEVMKEHGQGLRGVIHCFSYSKELAQEYVKMGYYIGVGGVVTFKNAKKLKEVVETVPLERILLETDCPYLAPTPFRGKRNSSIYIPYIAEEIANIKGVTYDEVVAQTERNGKDLFRI